jgi:Ca2+-binding EF-hand superfamily protein
LLLPNHKHSSKNYPIASQFQLNLIPKTRVPIQFCLLIFGPFPFLFFKILLAYEKEIDLARWALFSSNSFDFFDLAKFLASRSSENKGEALFVSLEAFLGFCEDLEAGKPSDELGLVFGLFDKDTDGVLDEKELREMLLGERQPIKRSLDLNVHLQKRLRTLVRVLVNTELDKRKMIILAKETPSFPKPDQIFSILTKDDPKKPFGCQELLVFLDKNGISADEKELLSLFNSLDRIPEGKISEESLKMLFERYV